MGAGFEVLGPWRKVILASYPDWLSCTKLDSHGESLRGFGHQSHCAVEFTPCAMANRAKDGIAGSLKAVALNLLDLKAFDERISARDPDASLPKSRSASSS